MTTMKKAAAFAVALSMVLCLAGCSKGDSSEKNGSSSSEGEAAGSSQSELEKKIEEQQKTIDEQSKKLDKVEKILSNAFDLGEGGSVFADDFDVDGMLSNLSGDVHPIYDDTAVVEAYKSGDSSKITDEKDKFILETASKAIEDNIKDSMSDYEKEKAIYDFVFSQSHYDDGNLAAIPHTEAYSHTPYGVLHDHTAICVGNATTFKLFMDMLGIDCKIIHSTVEGEHAWNMVNIGGDWYHVDVTFDGGGNSPAYAQFNVTDAVKDNAGYPWDHDEFPKAESVKYNYAVQNAVKIDDVSDTAALLAKAIADKKTGIFFKLKLSDETLKTEGASVFFDNVINEISYQVNSGSYDCMGVPGLINDGCYYGGIAVSYYTDIGEGEEGERPTYDFSGIDIDTGSIYDAYLEEFGISLETSGMSSRYSNYFEE